MVYLGAANNSQYQEQATIVPLSCGFLRGLPRGAGPAAIVAWLRIFHLEDRPLVEAMLPEDGAPPGFLSSSPQPLPRILSSRGLWCSWAVSEPAFPKPRELFSGHMGEGNAPV